METKRLIRKFIATSAVLAGLAAAGCGAPEPPLPWGPRVPVNASADEDAPAAARAPAREKVPSTNRGRKAQ